MSYPEYGKSPIRCGNRKCDWTGTERDLIDHPDDAGKFAVRSVCPTCQCESYRFIRRKRVTEVGATSKVTPQ